MESNPCPACAARAAELAQTAAIARTLEREGDRLRTELNTARDVLAGMVGQYCDWQPEGTYFHMFMSAPEDAFEYLENIGWLKDLGRETYVFTEASGLAYKNESEKVPRKPQDEKEERGSPIPHPTTCARCGRPLDNVSPGYSIIAGGAAVCAGCLRPGEEIARARSL